MSIYFFDQRDAPEYARRRSGFQFKGRLLY